MVEPLTWRWPSVLNAALAAAGLGLAVIGGGSVLHSPFGGMRAPAYLVIWILGLIGFNRGLALLQTLAPSGAKRSALRIAKWVLPWLLPIPAILAVETSVLTQQIQLASVKLAPLVAYADAQLQNPEQVSARQPPAIPFPVPVHYYHPSGSGYVFWLTAPAIDLDGYTLSYEPDAGHWQRVHNDLNSAALPEPGLCILQRGEWHCTAETEQEIGGPTAPSHP